MLDRKNIAPGAYLTILDADKFCRQRITINFIWPATRGRATAEALLPLVLERGYAGCPDMTELSKKLARLYGASLSVDSSMVGANRVLTVAVTGLKDAFALAGERLSGAYAELAFGTAFTPTRDDAGGIDAEYVAIEKEQLREQLESEINEKRSYCIRQARRKFFGDDPAGIERWGYLDEVDGLTPQMVTEAFEHMARTAQVEVLALGIDAAVAERALRESLALFCRAPEAPRPPLAMPRTAPQHFAEPMDTVQGKLCLLFTAGAPLDPADDLAATRVAVALLGGTATSRLFQNVREKESLCYYCSAGFNAATAQLLIDSGVEHTKAEEAQRAILRELEALRTGPITEKELDETKRALLNSLICVGDSLQATESWWFSEIFRGTQCAPEDVMRATAQVTADDVRCVLARFSLSVVYCLTKGGADHE